MGLHSFTLLVSGVDPSDTGRGPSAKINRILRPEVKENIAENAWQLLVNPSDGFLQILQPWQDFGSARQYVQNLLTGAWGYWSNVPVISADTWQTEYYLGSENGVLYAYDGALDGTTASTPGAAIDYSILTSFQALGAHGQYKQIGLMRVVAVASGDATYNMKAIYDYDLSPSIGAPPGGGATAAAVWDSALWDAAIWDGELNGQSFLEGAAGIGRVAAIAMKGQASDRLTIIGWDLTLTKGGFL